MDLQLTGKAFVVTGGTRGIGAAIVDGLIAEGARVAFCARSTDQVQSKEAALKASGAQVFARTVDVADHGAQARFIEDAASHFGALDGFVANVSGGASPGLDGWRSALDVDLMSSVTGTQTALPHLARSAGAAVMIASISGVESMGQAIGYGPAKAALISYASQLGDEAGRVGVRVNAVSPGPILVEDGFWGETSRSNPQVVDAVKAQHPMGRLGLPNEVASAVIFLLSSRASWINRTNLIVDGGFTRRVQF